jgi:1-acyl-sn-glycerol-3-phosphate acyltransferase
MPLVSVARTLLTLVVGFLATIVAATGSIVLAFLMPTSPLLERTIRWWAGAWLRAAGVKLDVEGGEWVDRTRSYIVISNHQSVLDIMAQLVAIPVPIRFLAKKELFRIPLFAQAMRAVGVVEVDRQAGASIHEQINRDARKAVELGRSIIVYPEGTRSRSGRLKSFKKGGFTIAVSTGLPVLPVVVHGTLDVMRPDSVLIRPGTVQVVIHPAIEVDPAAPREAERLRDECRAVIAGTLGKLQAGAPTP